MGCLQLEEFEVVSSYASDLHVSTRRVRHGDAVLSTGTRIRASLITIILEGFSALGDCEPTMGSKGLQSHAR